MEGKSRRRTPFLFRILIALAAALLIVAIVYPDVALWLRVVGGAMETAGMAILLWLAYVSYWKQK